MIEERRPSKPLEHKCPFYNGRGKCGFAGVRECIHEKGMVPFPYVCSVEIYMEDQAMYGGEDE